MQVLELSEYERRTVALSSDTARALVAVAGTRVTVSPSPQAGYFDVTATSYVGTITLPELQILIRPKVSLHNLFLMLEVGVPPDAFGADPFAYASDPDLLPAMTAFYDRTLRATLARGLLRSYRNQSELLPGLRGRIDIPALVGRGSQPLPLPCTFDEYTADITENQLIKSAALRLLRLSGVPVGVRRSLRHSLAILDEVANVEPHPGRLPAIQLTRLNRRYQPALRLAEVVLRAASLIDRPGVVEASTFLVDMNRVFESFVAGRLRELLAGTLEVTTQDTAWLGAGRRVRMQPDLVFRCTGEIVYVADTKYKITYDGTGRSGDYYQLLAYVTALDLKEGVLIYCQSQGSVFPTEVRVLAAAKTLRVYPLDLSGSRVEIEGQLQLLAQWTIDRLRSNRAA